MAEKEATSQFDDEKVIEIEIERLRSFKNHPFKVEDDKDMHLLKDSIKKYGVLNPLIVRPVPDGTCRRRVSAIRQCSRLQGMAGRLTRGITIMKGLFGGLITTEI